MKTLKIIAIALSFLLMPSMVLAGEPYYDPRCNMCGVIEPLDGEDGLILKYYAGNISSRLCIGKKNRNSYSGHGIVTHPDDICDLNNALGKANLPKNGTVFSMCCNKRWPSNFRFPNNTQLIAYETQGFAIGLCSDFDGNFVVGAGNMGARCPNTGQIVDLADHLSIYQYCSNGDIREKRLNPNSVRSYLSQRLLTIRLPGGTDDGGDCGGGGGDMSSCGPPNRKDPRSFNCSPFLNAIDPAMNVVGGCGYAREGFEDANRGDVGGGCLKIAVGTGCATASTSVTLSTLGFSGAGCAVGSATLPLTACAGGVAAAGYGAYNCVQQSPSRGYAPENGYSTGYLDCLCDLYGIDR